MRLPLITVVQSNQQEFFTINLLAIVSCLSVESDAANVALP